MNYDIITIGDCMRDIFLFPAPDEMKKPVSDEEIKSKEHLPTVCQPHSASHGKADFEEYLVFGLGDKITIADVEFSIGGTAANVAAGSAQLGLKTGIISAAGGDSSGLEIIDTLRGKKVETGNIKVYKSKKSSFSIIISYKGERTIFVYHAFLPESFFLPKDLKTDWLYLGPMAEGYERIFSQIVSFVINSNIKVAINPGAMQIKNGLGSFGGLSRLIEIIFLNREEAQQLSGLPGVPKIKDMAKIINLSGPKAVVITDGKEGAYAYTEDDFFKVGIYPGHRLDATGAGDSFAAGFLAAVIEGEQLRECLKWGVVNAASVIEKIGAQGGLLKKSVIKKRIKEYRWPAESLRFS